MVGGVWLDKNKKRNLIEPAMSRLSICGNATRLSGAFLLVLGFRYRGLVKKGRGTLRCCSQACEARLRAYSCVVTCLLEHGEMPQRVAGLYRLTTARRPVGEPLEERFFIYWVKKYHNPNNNTDTEISIDSSITISSTMAYKYRDQKSNVLNLLD